MMSTDISGQSHRRIMTGSETGKYGRIRAGYSSGEGGKATGVVRKDMSTQ